MTFDPATASLALTIMSAGASVAGQVQTARAQKSANARQYQADMQAYRDNIEASNLHTIQDAKASTEKANNAALEARKAKATAITSAGESGVSGLSVGALLNDLSNQGLENVNNIEANYLARRESNQYDRLNIRNRTISSINSMPRVTPPDFIGGALKIGEGYVKYTDDRNRGSLPS